MSGDVLPRGLSRADVDEAQRLAGRALNAIELSVLSVMWSEHCSYRSSRALLARLPTAGPAVAVGPGENAGAVRIGDGLVAVFKMESHNHPSYLEPYQGAATGLGGILRDVFTMGARPVAALNSLRFGGWEHPRSAHLLDGVVRGLGNYGNCFGVPIVGGETRFHPSYEGNCLVNAFALGIAREDQLLRGRAAGVGNAVVYLGAATGRDGIHGATMASAGFEAGEGADRPTVQVGDPFTERLLLEAMLELAAAGVIVGVQDMGAAGLTSASVEMAGRGGCGMVLNLDAVPTRAADLTPAELLLSESQERMLLVVAPEHLPTVMAVAEKWDLPAAVVGEVLQAAVWRCTWRGEQCCELPVTLLTEGAPSAVLTASPPSDQARRARFVVPVLPSATEALLTLLRHPDLCSKRWIWEQYDHQIGAATLRTPGGDAGVVRIVGTDRSLAMTVEGNGRHVLLDPRQGAIGIVAEAARNLAAVGATPLGATDCLNFGSPAQPGVYWQLSEAIEGLATACEALAIPIVSGNVSLNNETDGRAILPTPTVAMVGLVPEGSVRVRATLEREGLVVALIGGPATHGLGGSLWLATQLGDDRGGVPPVDLPHERWLGDALRALIRAATVEVAHDLSDGGLAVALAELCLGDRLVGLEACLPQGSVAEQLFAEDHGRVLVAYAPEQRAAVQAVLDGHRWCELGVSGGPRLVLHGSTDSVDVAVTELAAAWTQALPRWMEGQS